jgi:molybdenum cofactor cytidylyltransferase
MTRRYFSIVPAAGQSVRMGQAKLLLPLAGQPLIAHTIGAWLRSGVDRILVVVRSDDRALSEVVQLAIGSTAQGPKSKVAVEGSRLELVVPESPPVDMKASVQAALAHVENRYSPAREDAFLIAPADIPRLSPTIVDRLIMEHQVDPSAQILAPALGGKRGHPVLFPWKWAADMLSLVADEGPDAIVRRNQPRLVPCDDLVASNIDPFADIDTPDQYRGIADCG